MTKSHGARALRTNDPLSHGVSYSASSGQTSPPSPTPSGQHLGLREGRACKPHSGSPPRLTLTHFLEGTVTATSSTRTDSTCVPMDPRQNSSNVRKLTQSCFHFQISPTLRRLLPLGCASPRCKLPPSLPVLPRRPAAPALTATQSQLFKTRPPARPCSRPHNGAASHFRVKAGAVPRSQVLLPPPQPRLFLASFNTLGPSVSPCFWIFLTDVSSCFIMVFT